MKKLLILVVLVALATPAAADSLICATTENACTNPLTGEVTLHPGPYPSRECNPAGPYGWVCEYLEADPRFCFVPNADYLDATIEWRAAISQFQQCWWTRFKISEYCKIFPESCD